MLSDLLLNYHKIDTRFEFGVTTVAPFSFRKQMQTLAENGYKVVPVREAIAQNNPKIIGLSFDDGYESVFTNAFPILQEFGFTGTVFMPSDFIGKWNSWDVILGWIRFRHLDLEQLKILEKHGWEIGAHSKTHLDLVSLSEDENREEIICSKRDLEQHFSVSGFAYPFSRNNSKIRKIVENVGFDYAVGVEKSNDFHFSRVSVYRFHSPKMVLKMLKTGKQSKVFKQASRLTILVKKSIYRKP